MDFGPFHGTPFLFCLFFQLFVVYTLFRISKFFGLSITEETYIFEMCICCLEIGALEVLHLTLGRDCWWIVGPRGFLQSSSEVLRYLLENTDVN
jgi:hypothetical protein